MSSKTKCLVIFNQSKKGKLFLKEKLYFHQFSKIKYYKNSYLKYPFGVKLTLIVLIIATFKIAYANLANQEYFLKDIDFVATLNLDQTNYVTKIKEAEYSNENEQPQIVEVNSSSVNTKPEVKLTTLSKINGSFMKVDSIISGQFDASSSFDTLISINIPELAINNSFRTNFLLNTSEASN